MRRGLSTQAHDDDFTTSIYFVFDALSTAHHSAYRICIFWSHLIPRHGSSTYDAAHFPNPFASQSTDTDHFGWEVTFCFGHDGHSEDGWGCTFPSGFFLHGRAFVLLELHHDDLSGWRRGEIGITSIPPSFCLLFRRPEKGAVVAVLVQLSTAKYSPLFR